MMRSDFESSAAVADELLEIAEDERDPSLLSEAHLLTGVNCIRLAGLSDALEHVSTSVDYEDRSTSGFVRFRVGPHPKVASNTVKALLLWLTGKPDSALAQMARTLEVATELGHPYSMCFGRFHAGLLDLWRQDLAALGDHADELLALADAHDYPIWRALGLVLRGAIRVGTGATDAGLADVDEGFTLYQGLSTPPVFWPALLGIRAATCARAGRLDDALTFIEAAEEAMHGDDPLAGDIPIVKGDLLLALDPTDPKRAERLFERAAAVTAERGARMVELQAMTRLATLLRGTPREAEARECLRRVLDTFTEGFATPQLIAARAALES
jgi:hypothetical protein